MTTQFATDFSALVGTAPIVVLNQDDTADTEHMASLTSLHGGRFRHVTPGDTYVYNPLGTVSQEDRVNIVLNMREYDSASAVYKSNMYHLLNTLFTLIDAVAARRATCFAADQAAITPRLVWDRGPMALLSSLLQGSTGIEQLVAACEGTPVHDIGVQCVEQVRGKTQSAHAFSDLRGQLRTLELSEYWTILQDNGTRPVNLLDKSNTADVTVFDLTSDNIAATRYLIGLIRGNVDLSVEHGQPIHVITT